MSRSVSVHAFLVAWLRAKELSPTAVSIMSQAGYTNKIISIKTLG